MDCDAWIHNPLDQLEQLLLDENAVPKDIPLSILKDITNNFSDDRLIGSGGFAMVFKGQLRNGTVAVKKLSQMLEVDEKKYNREVRSLMMVNHKNIVRFLGYCADTQGKMVNYEGKIVMADVRQRLLCFEYLPNGSLERYITDASKGLAWKKRYQIIKGICEGLHYLHYMNILHLDLKPANILLDGNMVPKIADFGLSRCFDEALSRSSTSKLLGSVGYLAPEFYSRVITFKLDIYSLGVIIMEILTGEKGYCAVEKVLGSWRNRMETSEEGALFEHIRVCAEIGIECIHPNPENRPTTQRIIEMLAEIESTYGFIETGATLLEDCAKECSLRTSTTSATHYFENKLDPANSTNDRSSNNEQSKYSERIYVDLKSMCSDIGISISSAHSKSSDVSSAHTESSHVSSSGHKKSSRGNGDEDHKSLGNVYFWGTSSRPMSNRSIYSPDAKAVILLPKPILSIVALDVSSVACGLKHAALVTTKAEVFTWGDDCIGSTGGGVGIYFLQPRLVETFSIQDNVEQIACGDFHACAVTATGRLYTWGDGTYNWGLLGHGNNVGHQTPIRVSGPLEGLRVSSVSCGTWHTALITSFGQLFTFGDGFFGVLGHGDRESTSYPKEVMSLKGLRTMSVSCGVWHTAAVVQVISSERNTSSGKLFTWGDGDKNKLGHGDQSDRLVPTCVSSLIDYNFDKTACGVSITVGLTTTGQIFTVGRPVYGQLGNPKNDGRYPGLVKEKIGGVVEVVCGSYHVSILTNAGEVYTWGKGADGQLGHGDTADSNVPMPVKALRGRSIKNIACGPKYTVAICEPNASPRLVRSQPVAERFRTSALQKPKARFGFRK